MKRIHENITGRSVSVKGLNRGRIELLRSRLNLLTGTDKLLMTMYVKHGNSIRQIARVRGTTEASIARKIHTITERLTDGPYIRCLRNRDKLTARQLAIARDYYLTGLSIRRIAAKRRWSYYRVHETLNEIQSIINAEVHRTG
jgi:predicted DNA-binding protein YlxM (UPF0122 family)